MSRFRQILPAAARDFSAWVTGAATEYPANIRPIGRHGHNCDNTGMTKATTSKLSANGLRYDAKPPGSPFLGTGNTRSCFLCGTHRQHAQLRSKRVLGRTEMVCNPACNSVV